MPLKKYRRDIAAAKSIGTAKLRVTKATKPPSSVTRKPSSSAAPARRRPDPADIKLAADFDALMARLDTKIAKENSVLDALLERLSRPAA
jgi:hypothetical protein